MLWRNWILGVSNAGGVEVESSANAQDRNNDDGARQLQPSNNEQNQNDQAYQSFSVERLARPRSSSEGFMSAVSSAILSSLSRLTKSSNNSLSHVAEQGRVADVRQILLEQQIHVNEICKALRVASKKGHAAVVEILADDPRVDVNQADHNNFTAFYLACLNNRTQVVKVLLDGEVDVNKKNSSGETPLYLACQQGRTAIVEMLLADQRVHVNKGMNKGFTPLHAVCTNGRLEVLRLLLAEQRVDVNKIAHGKKTPLFIACENCKLEVVQILLDDKRVNAAKATDDGDTPWQVATYWSTNSSDATERQRYTQIVQLLQDYLNKS